MHQANLMSFRFLVKGKKKQRYVSKMFIKGNKIIRDSPQLHEKLSYPQWGFEPTSQQQGIEQVLFDETLSHKSTSFLEEYQQATWKVGNRLESAFHFHLQHPRKKYRW